MIHASYFKPRVFPIYVDDSPAGINRVQELTAGVTLNRSKIREVGRDGLVGWHKTTPTANVTLRQLEHGAIEFWRKLANKATGTTKIEWTDFKTSSVDIAGYKTDDDGTFLGTIYYPGLRMSGFGLNIGDPEALIERTFNLVGEDEYTLLHDNKYLIYKKYTLSGGTDETVTIDDPSPALDPDDSAKYLFKVVRTRSGVSTLLEYDTDWEYDGVDELTINGTSVAGDVIRVWYSAEDYISGEEPFTENDSDLSSIDGDSVSIYLRTNDYVYRLQSISVDVSFERFDVKEIGNTDIVSRGVREITNRITLGRILESYTIEEILRGKGGEDYGKIDVREFEDDIDLIVKIYSDSDKGTFKLGYKFTDLSPSSVDAGAPVNEYVTRGVTLEGDEAFVTSVEGDL